MTRSLTYHLLLWVVDLNSIYGEWVREDKRRKQNSEEALSRDKQAGLLSLYQIRFSLTGPSCDRRLVFLERRIQGLPCKIGTKIRELDELTRVLNREFSEWENSLRNKNRFSS